MNIVKVRGRPYSVNLRGKKLTLRGKGINKITEIEGLDGLEALSELDLSNNEISEFKGLDNPYLENLWIRENSLPKEALGEISRKFFKDIY